MIELYLRIKIHLDVLQEGLNMPNLENQGVLHFEFRCQKLLSLYHNTHILLFGIDLSTKLYHGLWFNRPHLSLFQNMSVKIYVFNVFLYLGGYNSIPDFWTMDASVGPWTLDAGCWTLVSGLSTLDAGRYTLDPGLWHRTLSLTVLEQNQKAVSDSAWLNYWKFFGRDSLRAWWSRLFCRDYRFWRSYF